VSGKQRKPAAGRRLAAGLFRKPEGKVPVRVCVGLDYGTSSTKVVIRAREGNTPAIWAPRLFGEACYASTVSYRAGDIQFGPPPRGKWEVRRSLKVRLRDAALRRRPRQPVSLGERSVGIDLLVWGYLRHVVCEIKAQLAKRYPSKRYSVESVEWHLGVPLDQRQLPVERVFRDVFFRAVHSDSEALKRRVSLAALEEAYAGVRLKSCPPEGKSDCFVRAEAAVAVNSVMQDQGVLEDGKYLICDVGAGTIDIAFFWFGSRAERPITFYGTACKPYGGDAFFRVVKAALGRGSTKSPEKLHAAALKQLHGGALSSEQFSDILQGMSRARSRGFGLAMGIESMDRWDDVTAFVIGGARHMPGVTLTCGADLRTGVGKNKVPVFHRSLALSGVKGATDLHWIAYGLSVPIHEFHDYESPEEAQPVRSSDFSFKVEEWDRDPYGK
jgi:hypothetical protein